MGDNIQNSNDLIEGNGTLTWDDTAHKMNIINVKCNVCGKTLSFEARKSMEEILKKASIHQSTSDCIQEKKPNKETCKWTTETFLDDIYFLTNCGKSQFFSEGRIKENGYEYCPFCGEEIEEEIGVKEMHT